MKIKIFIITLVTTISSFANAHGPYYCAIDLTHHDCTFFCEAQAKARAEKCALLNCRYGEANLGRTVECEISASDSYSYVDSFAALSHFIGRATANPKN